MELEKTYIAAKDFVVEGQKVKGGTLVDELAESHRGVWTNEKWLNEAFQCGHIIEAPEVPQMAEPTELKLTEAELDSIDKDLADDDEDGEEDEDNEDEEEDEEVDSIDTETDENTTTEKDGDEDELTNETSEINATDAAIRMANENGLDLSTVTGRCVGGRITQPDVVNALEAATNPN